VIPSQALTFMIFTRLSGICNSALNFIELEIQSISPFSSPYLNKKTSQVGRKLVRSIFYSLHSPCLPVTVSPSSGTIPLSPRPLVSTSPCLIVSPSLAPILPISLSPSLLISPSPCLTVPRPLLAVPRPLPKYWQNLAEEKLNN
jgi:hypothetical protein